jgi:bifunctional non-homologous end joining protein LigD
MSPPAALEVDGRSVRVTNLDKVLYPDDGTTKHDVLVHYLSVASVILPQLAGRPMTRKRWPDGVTGKTVFFEKNVPRGTPEWIRTVTLDSPGSSKDRERVTYPIIENRAGLAWVANLAALELHVPQWQVGPRGGVHNPDRLVIDLDPGPPAGLDECAQVALLVRERLSAVAHDPVPVTSGSKGMQLYAALNGGPGASVIRDAAKKLAQQLQAEHPDLVVSDMKRAIRGGKVLLDWSQNSEAKTTIAPYSLRGRDRAYVATPRTWAEVEAGGMAQVHRTEIPERLERYGDLMAALRD